MTAPGSADQPDRGGRLPGSPFTAKQLDDLDAPLDYRRVNAFESGPQKGIPYVEAYDCIYAANGIFGYGNWGYRALSIPMLVEAGTAAKSDTAQQTWGVLVELTVRGCLPICEIGLNTRSGAGASGLEMAVKGAVSDGLKRCLKTFGDQFGLVLYDRDERSYATLKARYEAWVREQEARPAPAPAPAPAPVTHAAATTAPAPAPAPAPEQPPVAPEPVPWRPPAHEHTTAPAAPATVPAEPPAQRAPEPRGAYSREGMEVIAGLREFGWDPDMAHVRAVLNPPREVILTWDNLDEYVTLWLRKIPARTVAVLLKQLSNAHAAAARGR